MKNAAALLALGLFALPAASLRADQLNLLKTSATFAVLGSSTVTNTGPTVLSGNLGLSPGTSITGFGPGIVNSGAIHNGDGVAIQAAADALSAYTSLAAMISTQNLTGQDLGGLTLDPGVFSFASSAQLTGALTLDFEGLSDQSFIFQTGSTLTTASDSSVNIINAGTNDSVYWQIGSSATLGTGTAFAGAILAADSITLNTGASISCGNALALTGAVTLDSNSIGACPSDVALPPGSVSPVPEPGTLGLLATGVLSAGGMIRRRFTS